MLVLFFFFGPGAFLVTWANRIMATAPNSITNNTLKTDRIKHTKIWTTKKVLFAHGNFSKQNQHSEKYVCIPKYLVIVVVNLFFKLQKFYLQHKWLIFSFNESVCFGKQRSGREEVGKMKKCSHLVLAAWISLLVRKRSPRIWHPYTVILNKVMPCMYCKTIPNCKCFVAETLA